VEADEEEPAVSAGERRTIARFPRNGAESLKVFVTDNLAAVIVGATLIGGSLDLDGSLRREVGGSDLGGLRDLGDTLGDSEVVVPLTAGLFAAGRATGPGRFRDMTYDLAQTQLLVTVLGVASKRLVGRERPNHRPLAFPSGHSYTWSATAVVVHHHYGAWAALPVAAVWGFTSLSRVANDTHHASDIVGGAVLGYLAARATTRANGAPSRKRLQVTPLVGHRQVGVVVALNP
jgi:membrane-associated phospholipid phosphatase